MGDEVVYDEEAGVCYPINFSESVAAPAWSPGDPELDNVARVLGVLQAEAANFGSRFINDAQVRQSYQQAVMRFSQETLDAVRLGEISAYEGAKLAGEMRNELMRLARLKTSDIGRAAAEGMKAQGLLLDQLLEKYAQKKFGKGFLQLAEAEKKCDCAGSDRKCWPRQSQGFRACCQAEQSW